MNRIDRTEFYSLVGSMIQGICANPTNTHLINDSYTRQQMTMGVIQDIGTALQNSGILVAPDE